jgi:nucleoside-triphosphatase THEP1
MKSVFIITGEKKSGKTLFLKNIIPLLQQKGLVTGGFLALHHEDTDSYSIKNIQTSEEVLLMKRRFPPQPRPEHFQIMQEGFMAGSNWLNQCLNIPPSLIAMDEIGYYELEGMVWHNQFSTLVKSSIPLIFTVNIKNLSAIIEQWNLIPTTIFYPNNFQHIKNATKLIINNISNIGK